MLKTCTGPCKQEKDIEEFDIKNKKTGTRRSYCTVCRRELIKKHYRDNKAKYKKKAVARNKVTRAESYERVYQYLRAHPCVDCKEPDPIVLEFDHMDRAIKFKNVSDMIRSAYSWEMIFAEIEKCEVRCANCHRRRTAKQLNWHRARVDQSEGVG